MNRSGVASHARPPGLQVVEIGIKEGESVKSQVSQAVGFAGQELDEERRGIDFLRGGGLDAVGDGGKLMRINKPLLPGQAERVARAECWRGGTSCSTKRGPTGPMHR